ncbi:hypothetical protein GCM10022276_00040 [Sphingomonas limnosediminicola]|uniref:Glycosyltransferase n=1 Tax=Sphingomonas limnosediminicola TaxID=940133 RepID=A0ABP7KRC4_9SPHN
MHTALILGPTDMSYQPRHIPSRSREIAPWPTGTFEPLLSVIVPVKNEEAAIDLFVERVSAILDEVAGRRLGNLIRRRRQQ